MQISIDPSKFNLITVLNRIDESKSLDLRSTSPDSQSYEFREHVTVR